MSNALRMLRDCIESTGGLVSYPNGDIVPLGDRDWLDLADAYLAACAELDVEPMVSDVDDFDEEEA